MVYTPTNLYCSRHSKLCSSSCVYHWVSYFPLRLSLPLILIERTISLSQFFFFFFGVCVLCFIYNYTKYISIECSHSIDKKHSVFAGPFILFDNPGFFILCHKGFLIIIFVPALENIKDVHDCILSVEKGLYIEDFWCCVYCY